MQRGIRTARRLGRERETPRRCCPIPPGGSVHIRCFQAGAGWRRVAAAFPVGRRPKLAGAELPVRPVAALHCQRRAAQATPAGCGGLPAGALLYARGFTSERVRAPKAADSGSVPAGGDCTRLSGESPSELRSGAETAAISQVRSGIFNASRCLAEPRPWWRGDGFLADPGCCPGGRGGAMALEDSIPLRGRLYIPAVRGLAVGGIL